MTCHAWGSFHATFVPIAPSRSPENPLHSSVEPHLDLAGEMACRADWAAMVGVTHGRPQPSSYRPDVSPPRLSPSITYVVGLSTAGIDGALTSPTT